MDATINPWWEGELAGCAFADERLGQRLRKLIERMDGAIGGSLPFACQDWANTKAAYRFFSNDRVSEAQILAGHFQATRDRFAATDGTILVLQDTTEFTFQRERAEAVGITYRVNSGKDKAGRFRMHTVCGLLMHASLAVTTEGLPLGLSAVKFWSRQQFKGTAALKRKINPTRVPIEQKESIRWLENLRQSMALLGAPARCVHVGDRESDIYELFCTAQELGTHFVVRSCVDRLAGDGDHTIADEMDEVRSRACTRLRSATARAASARRPSNSSTGASAFCHPIGKQKRYPALALTVIHARERDAPADRPAIDWKLITDLPVRSHGEAIEKLRWYALRWKIEVFHKILKSGCRAEESAAANRGAPGEADRGLLHPELAGVLDDDDQPLRAERRSWPCAHHWRDRDPRPSRARQAQAPPRAKTLSAYLTKVARLGGYLARTRDPPPGNIVMWRGLSRLTDIALGATLAQPRTKCG